MYVDEIVGDLDIEIKNCLRLVTLSSLLTWESRLGDSKELNVLWDVCVCFFFFKTDRPWLTDRQPVQRLQGKVYQALQRCLNREGANEHKLNKVCIATIFKPNSI